MVVSQENSILTLEYMTKERENQFFDRKSARKPVRELANFVASFANASGGTLVIDPPQANKISGKFNHIYKDFL